MSTLDDYQNGDTIQTTTSEAPSLVHEGNTADGSRLMSIEADDGVKYWFRERNQTTLQLQTVDDESGENLPSEVVADIHYEDLPDEVRVVLKREGFRMTGKNSLLGEVM